MELSQSQQTTSFLALSSDETHGRLGEAQKYQIDLIALLSGINLAKKPLNSFEGHRSLLLGIPQFSKYTLNAV